MLLHLPITLRVSPIGSEGGFERLENTRSTKPANEHSIQHRLKPAFHPQVARMVEWLNRRVNLNPQTNLFQRPAGLDGDPPWAPQPLHSASRCSRLLEALHSQATRTRGGKYKGKKRNGKSPLKGELECPARTCVKVGRYSP